MKEEELKETKIQIPADCEVDKIEMQDGYIVATFKAKERKLPKSWEKFCEMFPFKPKEFYITDFSKVVERTAVGDYRDVEEDKNMLPDRATAEAVLALCQLIQLRNAYNGDWVPDWTNCAEDKFVIDMYQGDVKTDSYNSAMSFLYFKTDDLRDEFLRNFRDLIEKLKPLYGIKKGGEK